MQRASKLQLPEREMYPGSTLDTLKFYMMEMDLPDNQPDNSTWLLQGLLGYFYIAGFFIYIYYLYMRP